MLSLLGVSNGPETCLRHRCSSLYLRISPLHQEFQSPLPHSSLPVPTARPRLSLGFSRQTRQATYELFTPNNSGQRLRQSEEHTSELQSRGHLVCRLLLEKK